MLHVVPEELFIAAIEMVCYFCAVAAAALYVLFTPRL